MIGIVTLENVLEEIIGDVDDEFDNDEPLIVPEGADEFIVRGRTPLSDARRQFDLEVPSAEIDTFAGWLLHRAQRILSPGDRIECGAWTAEILEVRNNRARRIRMTRARRGPALEDPRADTTEPDPQSSDEEAS